MMLYYEKRERTSAHLHIQTVMVKDGQSSLQKTKDMLRQRGFTPIVRPDDGLIKSMMDMDLQKIFVSKQNFFGNNGAYFGLIAAHPDMRVVVSVRRGANYEPIIIMHSNQHSSNSQAYRNVSK